MTIGSASQEEEGLLLPQGEKEQADGVGELPHPLKLPPCRAEELVGLLGLDGRRRCKKNAERQTHRLVFPVESTWKSRPGVLPGVHEGRPDLEGLSITSARRHREGAGRFPERVGCPRAGSRGR